MNKLRIGFVGVGGMGQMPHLSNYVLLDDQCEVAALAEPRRELAQTTGKPLCPTVETGRELVRLGKERGVLH